MRDDQYRFLSLQPHLPARLTVEQTAWLLNCQSHDIPILTGAKLLKPLGNPPSNGIKFFCTAEVLELSKDKTWLTKVSNAVYHYWQHQNAQKKARMLRDGAVAEQSATAAGGLSACARN